MFNFQDPASIIMEGIINVHHTVQFYLIVVLTLVTWMIFSLVYRFGFIMYIDNENDLLPALENRKLNLEVRNILHGTVLEIVWTITPTIILIFIGAPTFSLLYAMDELIEPTLTLKVIGHQWYWSYEYSDYSDDIIFDSYMLPDDELSLGQLRLLEVDKKVWLPINTHIRLLITATDVLHCWAIPSFGVKVDAVPGRLNQGSLFIKREGLFYGQCSELCGVNHGFMPICVKAVSLDLYVRWIEFNLNN